MADRLPPSASALTRRGWLRLALTGVSIAGCGRFSESDLIIATTWSQADRIDLESRLDLGQVSWVEPTGIADPTLLISRGFPAHFVLGGPSSSYDRLAREGRLASPAFSSRAEPIGLALRRSSERPGSAIDLTDPAWSGRWQLPDPRRDPVSLAWCRSYLTETAWTTGYARLVQSVALAAPAHVPPDSPSIQAFPTVASRMRSLPDFRFVPEDRSGAIWTEGMAIVRMPSHSGAVNRLVQDVALPNFDPKPPDPLETSLLADLLGAVLVDARPELTAARLAIETHRDRTQAQRAGRWMVEPPPWPPASVRELSTRPDSGSLMGDLAAQVVPDSKSRLWLLESWVRPTSPIDGALLASLARAEGGRLALEDRFRAWLRVEWSTWAAQRFRRAQRLALGFEPAPAPNPEGSPA